MNLVGKIFVVLILLMSFVFMGFAVAVYATHQNWEQVVNRQKKDAIGGQPVGLRIQRDEARAERDRLAAEKAAVEERAKTELAARQARLAQLETEAKELRTEHDALVNEHATLVQREREAVATMEATQQTLAAMRKELDVLRSDIRTAQTERDEQFKEFVKLTDDYNQSQGELKRLKAQTMTLADQVARYEATAARLKVDLRLPPEDVKPTLDGLVLAANKDGLVEISLGSDDGLERGHTLEVFRGSRYLGRIEVSVTQPDKSVAKILPQFRKGPIAKDDHVATRFN
ncbi:MAG TPA: hypothetical protein VHD36_13580 [Pirellulales bacterium]|nr:hypothetical protein [Pirellulales bacterium]